MQKLKIIRKDGGLFLTLDSCRHCGGVWFDKDEIKLSQQITSSKVRQRITQKPEKGLIPCRSCHVLIDRNLDQCLNCGWHNRINCPVCEQQLQRQQHKQLTLDICHSCQGVWFDYVELSALWSGSSTVLSNFSARGATPAITLQQHNSNGVTQAVGETLVEGSLNSITYGADILEPGMQRMADTAGNAAKGSVEALANTPEIARGVVESLAEATDSALKAVGELPEMATVVLEVTSEIAGNMTEGLADILASLFS